MNMKKLTSILLAATLASSSAFAADPIVNDGIPEPSAIDLAGKGIWGSIAYSGVDHKRGIFWGANTKDEAEAAAVKHCEHAGGKACNVAVTFRNHRHGSDNDGSGFPYEPCAALAAGNGAARKWGATSAPTIRQAQKAAIAQCGSASCRIIETICT
ncbi:DUF4189 domain-containing protein [Phyllobacterium sp. P30BS-XVII]|uniref:DUF4189 domain-containing protein n=1 Tax=Phyllobacterium sp. P30BS-XVII TaxID=2587046 RepID=UPI0015FC56B8|nr:DUF4189 domain-containing protein [Phyllobacterium sp. P30BS-XVII]MBA8904135.1 hypothetical protein [Phyllobacterium sp. P30BS-XVII]